LIHAVSLFWAKDLNQGIEFLSRYIPFLLFSFVFCLFQIDKKTFDRLLLIYFRGAFIFIVISLFCWLHESFRLQIPLNEWLVFFDKKNFSELISSDISSFNIIYSWTHIGYHHPTYNATAICMSTVIGFYLLGKKREKFSKIEFLVYLFAAVLLIIITQSRVGLVSFVLVICGGIFYLLRHHRKWQIAYSAVVILLSVLTLSVFLTYLFSENRLSNDSERLKLYPIAISTIQENPIIGVGVGNMKNVFIANNCNYPHPHNQFVGDFMQTGILGFSVLMVMLTSIIFTGLKRNRFLLLSLFLCIMLPLMIIEMPFQNTQGLIIIFLFCGLFLKKIEKN
jgi:O-antigen ligase